MNDVKYVPGTPRGEIPPAVLAHLRRRYLEDNVSSTVLAKEQGVSGDTVLRLLAIAGVPRRRPGRQPLAPSPGQLTRARELYTSGLSILDTAYTMGKSPRVVRRWLVGEGVTLRPSGGRGKNQAAMRLLVGRRQGWVSDTSERG